MKGNKIWLWLTDSLSNEIYQCQTIAAEVEVFQQGNSLYCRMQILRETKHFDYTLSLKKVGPNCSQWEQKLYASICRGGATKGKRRKIILHTYWNQLNSFGALYGCRMLVEVSKHTEGSKDKMTRPNGLPESLIRYDGISHANIKIFHFGLKLLFCCRWCLEKSEKIVIVAYWH